MRPSRVAHVPLACAAAAVLAAASAGAAEPEGDWRAARWGMTQDEVLKAFPGEAARLDPPQKLADGNTVAVGIEKHEIGATPFRVRFVFDPGGKLALVSLRTDQKTFAGPPVFKETRDVLVAQLGKPGAESSDDNYIDMRQTSWWTKRSRIDLKYIDGVVVVLHSPTDGGPKAPPPEVPPLIAAPPGK
jgi:hypothetical protein